jgi:predicted AAA+ superfamily ATPase
MIKRSLYLDKIIPFVDKDLIKIIIGVRRSGKTVLLNQIKEYIENKKSEDDLIIYLNFESYENRNLLNGLKLHKKIINDAKNIKGKVYLFFDEIQEVDEWQRIVNSFRVDLNCDIYLTGSNSNLLSGELATYIAGRYVHFNVYPFTFKEAIELSKLNNTTFNNKELFLDYLKFGGLPQRYELPKDEMIKAYLDDVYNTIVLKDIIARNKIKDVDLLKRILNYLMDNIGNTFSANSIANFLKSEKRKVTVDTVLNYIEYIKNAMIVSAVNRYDLEGKKILSTNEKYFSADVGLRNVVKNNQVIDYSKLFENIVYLEMLSRGYEVRVGKLGVKEVDFICYKNHEIIYIQVAYILAEESTIEREFSVLEAIDDNYPKYVISFDEVNFSRNGIIHKNIIDFLLEK